MKTSKRLNKVETLKAIQEYKEYCMDNYKSKNDNGSKGKYVETRIRAMLHKDKSLNSNDIKARKQGKQDIRIKIDGKFRNIEVKTGCGVLQYDSTIESINELNIQDLLPNIHYVIYCPEYMDSIEIENQFFVFERDDFLKMLVEYNPKKPYSWLKLNKSRRCVNIQTFRTSNKKYNYLWDNLEEQLTLKEFLEQIER